MDISNPCNRPVASTDAPALSDDIGRRGLLSRLSFGAVLGGMSALAGCEGNESPAPNADTGGTPVPTPTATTIQPVTDTDLLVLMIQLHYVTTEFFARAVLGAGLPDALVAGTGSQGAVSGPRQVTFADTTLGEQMRELAAEKIDQLMRLRSVLGASTPARPAINLGVDPAGTFTKYGVDAAALPSPVLSAPVITDVYANQDQFLLAAFIVQDPVMNAWRAVSTMLTTPANIELSAGMLSASALHAGLVRSLLFRRGGTANSRLRQNSIYLSNLRDSYAPSDDDKGVSTAVTGTGGNADVNPADGDGLVYNRLANFTLNTFFMTTSTATSGGFFPAGVNGSIKASATTG